MNVILITYSSDLPTVCVQLIALIYNFSQLVKPKLPSKERDAHVTRVTNAPMQLTCVPTSFKIEMFSVVEVYSIYILPCLHDVAECAFLAAFYCCWKLCFLRKSGLLRFCVHLTVETVRAVASGTRLEEALGHQGECRKNMSRHHNTRDGSRTDRSPGHCTKLAEDNFYRKKKCIYNDSSMWGWGRSAERMHQEWKFKTKCRSWIVFQKIQHLQELHAMETLATNRTDGH